MRRRWIILALVIFTSLVALFPAASPPANLSWSRGPFTDEGLKTYNARNFVLTGQWKFDEHDTYPGWHLRSPLFSALVVTSFKLNGVGLVQARLVGIFFGLLLPPAVALLLWRNGHRPHALVAWALISSSFLYIMYARLCLFDIALTTFMTLCLCGLTWGWNRTAPPQSPPASTAHWSAQVTLAMLAFLYAFLIKPVVLVMLPTVFIGLAASMRHRGIPLRRLILPVAVALAALLAFATFAFFRWDNATAYIANRLSLNTSSGIASSLAGVFVDLRAEGTVRGPAEFWRQTPILSTLAFCGLILTLRRWRQADPLPRLTVVWLLNYLLFLALINYKPNRYFLPLFPPLAVLASFFVIAVWKRTTHAPTLLPRLTLASALLLLVTHLSLSASTYFDWATHRRYDLLTASHSLNQFIPEPGVTVAGTWATPLVLETRLRCFPTGEGANTSPQQFVRYRPLYALLERSENAPDGIGCNSLARYAPYLQDARPLHTFPVGNYQVLLVRLVWKDQSPVATGQ